MVTARLTVDLDALRANYRLLADAASRVAAVVKADAYGLGAGRVTRALREAGCGHFFVATLEEGMALGEAAAGASVYVFSGPLDDAGTDAMAERGLVPVLNDAAQVVRWRDRGSGPAAVHVDTGMNRLGFPFADLDAALFDGVDVCLVLSHLANADEPADPVNARQVARFETVRALFPRAAASLPNSAGALSGAGTGAGMARAGIALYGGNPFATARNPTRTVARLEARVLALREVAPGEPVGYGGAFVARAGTVIATLGIGYADGVPRALAAPEVAWRGARLPVAGRVSMDLLQVDATRVAGGIAVDDWVEVFGSTIHVDEVAERAGTIAYEVLTGIGPRVVRRYEGG